MIVRELIAKVGFKVDQQSAKNAGSAMDKIKTAAKLAVGVFAAIKAGGAVGGLISDVTALGDSLDKLSQRLGVTPDSLQRIQHAANLSGVSIGEMQSGLMQLQRQSYQAARGSKEAEEGFARLGVSVRDSQGKFKDAETLLGEVADGLNRIPDETERTALAMTLLGRGGAAMKPMLNQGSKGIREMGDEVEALGAKMSSEAIANAVALTDNLARVGQVTQGLKNVIGNELIPIINSVTERFLEWYKASREWIQLKLRNAIQWVVKAGEGLVKIWRTLWNWGGRLWDVTKALFGPLGKLAVGFALLAAVISSPALLIAVLALGLEDFITWLEGGESVIGDFLGPASQFSSWWEALDGILEDIESRFKTVRKAWDDLIGDMNLKDWANMGKEIALDVSQQGAAGFAMSTIGTTADFYGGSLSRMGGTMSALFGEGVGESFQRLRELEMESKAISRLSPGGGGGTNITIHAPNTQAVDIKDELHGALRSAATRRPR